jgi:hypothetical protein
MGARGAPPAEMGKKLEAAVAAGESATLDFFSRAHARVRGGMVTESQGAAVLPGPANEGRRRATERARALGGEFAARDGGPVCREPAALHAIALDVGDRDGLRTDTAELHRLLDTYGIANTFELYPGDHVSAVADRMQNHVLPFFSRNLEFGNGAK